MLTACIAGFYLVPDLFPGPRFTGSIVNDQKCERNENKLILGPFYGKPACQFIDVGAGKARGVCADAFVHRQTVLVRDVHSYPGHIACDGDTNSEIVCPLICQGSNGPIVVGVLDLDCLAPSGFNKDDQVGLERISELIVQSCNW